MAKAFRWDDFVSFFNTLKSKLNAKLNAKLDKVENITYSALLAKVNNGTLTAGQQYRITDYVTTTAQADTQSAGHQFDIIVTADNSTTLNHSARAVLHEGDTYFANSNLAAWELKYDIKNDTTKYAWAKTSGGKGVIYEMIDEFNNKCGYDFKNIKFKCAKYSRPSTSTVFYAEIRNGLLDYAFPKSSALLGDMTAASYKYTFDMSGSDYSLYAQYCHNNTVGGLYKNNKYELNFITFQSDTQGSGFYNNIIADGCYQLIIPDGSYDNVFKTGVNRCYVIGAKPLIGKTIGAIVGFCRSSDYDNKADAIVYATNASETDLVITPDIFYQDRGEEYDEEGNTTGDWETDNFFNKSTTLYSSATVPIYKKTFPVYANASGYAEVDAYTSNAASFMYSLGDVTLIGEVTHKACDDEIINTTTVSGGITYTTAPIEIGTWIDGTPVYRVALPYIQMQNGVRGVRTDSATNSAYLNFRDLFKKYVIDYDTIAAFLGGWINWYSEYPNGFKGGVVPNGNITFCKNNAGDYEDYIEFNNGYWGGYVDFVSKASNIR